MKAPVLFQQKEPLRVEELEVEAPRAGEVAVRMVASGVCHSCLHAADAIDLAATAEFLMALPGVPPRPIPSGRAPTTRRRDDLYRLRLALVVRDVHGSTAQICVFATPSQGTGTAPR